MQNRRKTILIVDDDPNDALLIERAFRANGVEDPIHIVGSGSEAIAYLTGEGKFTDRIQYEYPGFLITDLKMPDGDGFSVLEHLRHTPDRTIIPTIVLSSSADPDDVKKSYQLGASSFHKKPLDHGELKAQLKLLHDYWTTSMVPEVDATGRQIETDFIRKLGARFEEQPGSA